MTSFVMSCDTVAMTAPSSKRVMRALYLTLPTNNVKDHQIYFKKKGNI